jgi:glyoxylase-like metal-dependent hydrolase (beta-lactamase superfamily II)
VKTDAFQQDTAMSELSIQNLAGRSWIIPGPTNIGIIETDGGVYTVDSGNDKDAGRKINKIITEKGWKLSGIINTHSNADHIGGNDYLQRMYGCRIYATQAEKAFIESPEIEPAFLWGGYPVKELDSKFFRAKPSSVTDVIGEKTVIDGTVTFIPLPGHFFGMTGVMTEDGVCYLGDCMFGADILEKYTIPFIYDVQNFKATIEKIQTVQASFYVMSHGKVETDIAETARRNLSVVTGVEDRLCAMLSDSLAFEDILCRLCTGLSITLDCGRYALLGSTVRSFLSSLYHEGRVTYRFENNKMMWEVNK